MSSSKIPFAVSSRPRTRAMLSVISVWTVLKSSIETLPVARRPFQLAISDAF